MRTLLIAPRHDSLPLALADAEVGEILNSGLRVTPVLGGVTDERFLQVVTTSTYEILFLVTHGTEQGVLLTDGTLPASMFVQAVRDRFDLIVLNSCSGLNVAQLIQNECGAGVICTIGDLGDRAAYYTGSQLAREIARGQNYYDAYKRSRPGANTTYVFLAGKLMSNSNLRMLVKEIVAEEMTEILASIEALKEEIAQDRMERAQHRTNDISITGEQLNRIVWALAAIAIIVAIGFFWLANGGGA